MRVTGWQSALAGYVLVAVCLLAGLRWFEPVRVSGGSMEPAMHAGDLALVARGRNVAEGDVALLRPPDHGPVLHRVRAVLPDGSVVTKGDANTASDQSPTDRRFVAGRVAVIVPIGRWLVRWR